jgi:predicted transcriptional regulator
MPDAAARESKLGLRSDLRAAYHPSMIDSLALLEAADHRGQNTTPEIAAILDVTESEAEQALRQAESDGLVHEETDESRNVAPDFNRQAWFLTDAGRDQRDRLRVVP